MNTPFLNFKRYVLAFVLLCLSQHIFAQSWLELRERGANFNDIKAAFERQYGSKLKKMKRELREEVTQSNVRSGKSEKELEGMIQYMRWAHFVGDAGRRGPH